MLYMAFPHFEMYFVIGTLLLFGLVADTKGGAEVTLEGRDVGFFLRTHQNDDFGFDRRSYSPSSSSTPDDEHRFTLLHSPLPVMVRSQFGPFAVKQTVLPFASSNGTSKEDPSSVLDVLPVTNEVDVSAHLVTHEVRRDRPVLRVLFHSSRASDPKLRQREEVTKGLCVALYVHGMDQHLMAACSPSSSRDGVCLAQATLPAAWWPPLESPTWKSVKTQKTWVRVEYAVLHSLAIECSDSALPVTVPAGLPSIFLAEVPLSGVHGSYEEVKSDDVVRILVPQGAVYPRSKVYVPVYLQPNPLYPPYVFVIRARVKSGLRILGAQVSQPSHWSISVELSPRQTVATVTAFVKDTATHPPSDEASLRAQEVFTWLFEVEEDAGYNDNGRILWQLRYMLDSSMAEQYDFDDDNTKITSRLDIQKDDVQAVLPIAKSSQLLNTAVLNGRQVSQPMKVFIVSQAGKVGDVTLQSSCHAADESILKVSPSCTSVYLDGSEIRGSQNASVLVKYGTYTGQAHFLVWMPELPLVVRLMDTKLSQIKGWKTPQLQRKKMTPTMNGLLGGSNRISPGRLSHPGSSPSSRNELWEDQDDIDIVCRLRYQQSNVDVYTRFFSVDHNSGRESYLLSRKAEFRVTELVASFLRVADIRIATLKGNVVQGFQSGRTEVQVLSPITGRVIGAKEVRVGSDKETITHLEVSVVTGLQLSVVSDETMPGVFIAQTSVSQKLTSQYQEGLLDIRLHYSDGSVSSLADITDTDYHLSVDTFDSGVVAFAPMAGLHHPRVIAIGEGKGDLLHVTLELAERCQKRRSQPLAMAYAYTEVDFSSIIIIQNDARLKGFKGLVDGNKGRSDRSGSLPTGNNDLSDSLVSSRDVNSILYQDAISPRGKSHYHEPAVQARQNLVHPSDLTPLEIGMYALLGVFCLAILVFLVSCSVFAVRYRRKQVPPAATAESVAHAHDWVWLGRATLERNSVNTRCSQTLVPMADFNGNHPVEGPDINTKVQRREKRPNGRQTGSGCRGSNISFPGSEISIRITTNPQELQEEETSMIEKGALSSVTNHNALRLPSNTNINSATITREKRVRIITNPVPPPLPPSAYPLKQIPAHPPPPIPPHRYYCPPPPIPPHNRHFQENPLSRFPRGAPTDAEWEAVAQGMDYDQLIEYFENLKESNA